MKTIDEIWAWVCIDNEGDEGIPALLGKGGMCLPCFGADKARIESLRPFILKEIAPNRPVKLVRFTNKQVIEVINK